MSTTEKKAPIASLNETESKTVTIAVAGKSRTKRYVNKKLSINTSFSPPENHIVKNEKDGPCFLQGPLLLDIESEPDVFDAPKGGKRTKRNGRRIIHNKGQQELMVFDIDNGMTWKEGVAAVKKSGLAAVMYTSYSHSPAADKHKFRVMFILEAPYQLQDREAVKRWSKLYLHVGKSLGLKIDEACKDVVHVFFLPSCSEENKHEAKFKVIHGDLLDLAKFENQYFAILDGYSPDDRIFINPKDGKEFNVTEFVQQQHGHFKLDAYLDDINCDLFLGDRTDGGHTMECPFGSEHASDDPNGAFVTDDYEGGFKISCSHETCKDRYDADFILKMLQDGHITVEGLTDPKYGALNAYESDMWLYTPKPRPLVGAYDNFSIQVHEMENSGAKPLKLLFPHWMRNAQDKRQNIAAEPNVIYFLNHMGIAIAYNEFSCFYELENWREKDKVVPLDEAVHRAIQIGMEKNSIKFGKEGMWTYLMHIGDQNAYHPVKAELDGLVWDREPRLDTWLTRYCNVVDTPYTRAVGSIWLIAAVRRLRDPGCKFDTMPVFESTTQGYGKSSMGRILAGDEYFTDSLPMGADDKLTQEQTAGKWFVEFGELSGIKTTDSEHLKVAISKQVDRARGAYGRVAKDFPRQFVFYGSTNDTEYLPDQTGNRRYWPLRVDSEIDLDGLRLVRDQLFAEAAFRESQGESITLDRSLWAAAQIEQNKRLFNDPRTDKIEEFISKIPCALNDDVDYRYVVRMDDLLAEIGHDDVSRAGPEIARKIGRVMRKNGWENKNMRVGGQKGLPHWYLPFCEGSKKPYKQWEESERINDMFQKDKMHETA